MSEDHDLIGREFGTPVVGEEYNSSLGRGSERRGEKTRREDEKTHDLHDVFEQTFSQLGAILAQALLASLCASAMKVMYPDDGSTTVKGRQRSKSETLSLTKKVEDGVKRRQGHVE